MTSLRIACENPEALWDQCWVSPIRKVNEAETGVGYHPEAFVPDVQHRQPARHLGGAMLRGLIANEQTPAWAQLQLLPIPPDLYDIAQYLAANETIRGQEPSALQEELAQRYGLEYRDTAVSLPGMLTTTIDFMHMNFPGLHLDNNNTGLPVDRAFRDKHSRPRLGVNVGPGRRDLYICLTEDVVTISEESRGETVPTNTPGFRSYLAQHPDTLCLWVPYGPGGDAAWAADVRLFGHDATTLNSVELSSQPVFFESKSNGPLRFH